MKPLLQHALIAGFGAAMGFGLARMGFADFGEVQRLFSFADMRLLFCFATAVGIGMIGFALLGRYRSAPAPRRIHRGTVPGGLLFGIGWALTGACPSVVLVQLGQGYLPALITACGVLLGVWMYRSLNRRYLRWDTGSCDS